MKTSLRLSNTFSRRAFLLALIFIVSVTAPAFAQTVSWTDSFERGVAPAPSQCTNWNSFLDQLSGKTFASVTISGTFDETGKTLSDPIAATALAQLLATRTPGTVVSEGHSWTVTKCQLSACADVTQPYSIALSYDGNTSECDCADRYAIRPQSTNGDWGGINVASSCNAASQRMRLVFNSGVSISVGGSTQLCEGSSVELTANAEICGGQVQYRWSNGATTRSISVNAPGDYFVTVSDVSGCSGVSETISITHATPSVSAGEDAIFCEEPVQLSALGTSSSGSGVVANAVCLYNAPGGVGIEDCTFRTDVCLEGAEFFANRSFSADASFSNPIELRYHLYYSAFLPATFVFILNDKEIGRFVESQLTGTCDTKLRGTFPRSFVFQENRFKSYWVEGGDNQISVEIVSEFTEEEGPIYLAGITGEVVTSNETYSWSPLAGLTDASIRNPEATPTETTVYTVTYTDANGCTATDDVKVTVDCSSGAPVAVCKEVVIELEEGCEANVEASAFDGGSTSSGAAVSFSAEPAGPYPFGVTDIVFTITDSDGSSSCTTRITVKDATAPVIADVEDITTNTTPGGCAAAISLVAPEAIDNCEVESVTHDHESETFPVGETIVTWTARDIHGNVQTATQRIVVVNSDPVIHSVRPSAEVIEKDRFITVKTTFTDDNARSATINWGDATAPIVVDNPAGTFAATHAYARTGFFNITVTVTDYCGSSSTYTYERILVYNAGGYVRGDGWFDSQKGYYRKDGKVSGKAHFHIGAMYTKGSAIPIGSASFKFQAAKLDFKSSSLEWLLIEDDRATLFAYGKLNGSKDYSILISAVDEDWNGHGKKKGGKKDKDKVRVKIWDPAGNVIYDTQSGQSDDAVATTKIGGGSIDIGESKVNLFLEYVEDAVSDYFGEDSPVVYPNPFTDYLNVEYSSSGTANILIQLMDLSGNVLLSQTFEPNAQGYYLLEIPAHVRGGIYIATIRQGNRIQHLRIVGSGD